ncbi:MAG TPA: YceI family protein [Bacteroidia bacterium]|nr:YceI family protein [Bacteroidia bacterium]
MRINIFVLMKRGGRLLLMIFLFCLPDTVNGQSVYSCTNGEVFFRSEAKLELIDAKSQKLEAIVDFQKKTFEFLIPINSFKGFNAELQREHFLDRYMESDKFPVATFTGKIIEDVDISKPREITVRAKGKLTIHGVEQERIIKSKISIEGNAVTVYSVFSVPLKDHKIKVPRVVQEKIANEVLVQVKAILGRK